MLKTGTDLVRDRDGEWYVLEDNLRSPSFKNVVGTRRIFNQKRSQYQTSDRR